ncbi:MAG TPA: YciI family protein [Burkholderiales bacterium]|nr:YciI family protein [Burkholderiales bacterium]
MKYLCLAYYDVKTFESTSKDELKAVVSQCPAHDAELRQSGHLLVQASLGEVTGTTTIRPKNGKPTVTDGPFTETKEQVGGFFMIEARDLNEAILIASKHPAAHLGEQLGWAIEVRPIRFWEQPADLPKIHHEEPYQCVS